MQLPIAPDAGFEVPPAATPASLNTQRSFSLREVWAAIYRSRFWIAGIMAACVAAAIAYSLLTTRLYDGKVSIEIRQEAEKVLGTEADRESGASKGDTDRFLQTQLDIIRSRGVANAVAEALGLYRGNAFLDAMKIEPAEGGTLRQTPQELHRDQVQQALIGNLKVEYTGNTRIANLRFRSPDPRLSMQVANSYADNFIRSNLDRKFDSSRYALDFLRNQLAEAQRRLEGSEREALGYARQTRIVDASNAASTAGGSSAPQSLVAAQLVQLNQAYTTAVADRINAQQKWDSTRSLPSLNIPEVLQSPAIQSLLEARATANAEYRQQLATRQADYPGVQQAAARLAETNRQIELVARNVRESARSAYEIARAQEERISRQLDSLKSNTLSEQNQSIQLSILRREADTNRQQYEALLRRFNALNAEAGVQTNNLSIVDRAQLDEAPAWPKLPLILALAIIAGTLLSGVFVIVREQLFDAIRLPDDVTERLRLTLLGSVPETDTPEEDLTSPKSAVSEAYSSIRTGLALLENGMPKTVMFTSTQASEGKSSACRAVAISLSRLGRTVLVIDADLRRPNAHRLFGLSNRAGVSTLVSGQATLDEVIQHSDIPGVDLIAAGDVPPSPSELINSKPFAQLIAQQADRYDIVLVDSAPVLGLADAVILSNQIEATVFIIEAGRNTVRGANFALTRLRRGGANVVGAVLTKYDPGRLGYGYGDEYGYGYKYES